MFPLPDLTRELRDRSFIMGRRGGGGLQNRRGGGQVKFCPYNTHKQDKEGLGPNPKPQLVIYYGEREIGVVGASQVLPLQNKGGGDGKMFSHIEGQGGGHNKVCGHFSFLVGHLSFSHIDGGRGTKHFLRGPQSTISWLGTISFVSAPIYWARKFLCPSPHFLGSSPNFLG